jgi:hypothetical protein
VFPSQCHVACVPSPVLRWLWSERPSLRYGEALLEVPCLHSVTNHTEKVANTHFSRENFAHIEYQPCQVVRLYFTAYYMLCFMSHICPTCACGQKVRIGTHHASARIGTQALWSAPVGVGARDLRLRGVRGEEGLGYAYAVGKNTSACVCQLQTSYRPVYFNARQIMLKCLCRRDHKFAILFAECLCRRAHHFAIDQESWVPLQLSVCRKCSERVSLQRGAAGVCLYNDMRKRAHVQHFNRQSMYPQYSALYTVSDISKRIHHHPTWSVATSAPHARSEGPAPWQVVGRSRHECMAVKVVVPRVDNEVPIEGAQPGERWKPRIHVPYTYPLPCTLARSYFLYTLPCTLYFLYTLPCILAQVLLCGMLEFESLSYRTRVRTT